MVKGILLELSISIYKHMIKKNLAEFKTRIEMGKMTGNGPGILDLLTAPPLSSSFRRGRQPLDNSVPDTLLLLFFWILLIPLLVVLTELVFVSRIQLH